jgi:MoxR-like ATPase
VPTTNSRRFLLELLSEYAVTIPELGTIRATTRPIVVLTSNRTRDVHDALKRRSLYHWVEHPGLRARGRDRDDASAERRRRLARQVTAAVQAMRELALYKPPGVAETIDWTESLALLGHRALDAKVAEQTLGVVLKYREDADLVRREGLGPSSNGARLLERDRSRERRRRAWRVRGVVVRSCASHPWPGRAAGLGARVRRGHLDDRTREPTRAVLGRSKRLCS